VPEGTADFGPRSFRYHVKHADGVAVCGDGPEVDDLLQHVFVIVNRKYAKVPKAPELAQAWLVETAGHTIWGPMLNVGQSLAAPFGTALW